MTKQELIKQLENINALRENRIRVSNLVLNDKTSIKHLLSIVFNVDEKVSLKAAWVLEFTVRKEFEIILPYVDLLWAKTKNIQFGGAVRSMAKIIVLIALNNNKTHFLSNKQEEKFVAITFDWMISTHKVAVKAYAMQTLFLLGKNDKDNWIHPELKIILIDTINEGSPAYKARGKITLAQIAKFQKKTVEK